MLRLLKLIPDGVQLGLLIAVVATLGTAAVAYRSSLIEMGAERERTAQKDRDDEAKRKAAEGRSDVGACYDAGGMWDSTRGVCNRR